MAEEGAAKRPRKRAAPRRPVGLEEVLARLDRLEARLDRLEAHGIPPRGGAVDAPGPEASGPVPSPYAGNEEPAGPSGPSWRVVPESGEPGSTDAPFAGPGASAPGSISPPPSPASPSPTGGPGGVHAGQPGRGRPRDMEEVLGANWLAKAGIAAVALGMVFLFQHAVVQGWLTLQLQILLGFFFGVALFVVGDVLYARRGMDVYGQVLAGGGAAIAYFSVFASYVFPEYREAMGTSLELASILLGTVAVAVLGYAALRHTPVLASVAMVLGAITVVFAGQWPLFAVVYVLLLTAAVLGVGVWRKWEVVVGVAVGAALVSLLVGRLFGLDATAALWAAFGVGVLGLAAAGHVASLRVALSVPPSAGFVVLVAGLADPVGILVAAGILAVGAFAVAVWRDWLTVGLVGLVSVYAVFFFAGLSGLAEFDGSALESFAVLHLMLTGLMVLLGTGASLLSARSASPQDKGLVAGFAGLAILGGWGLVFFILETVGWGASSGWVTLVLSFVLLAAAAVPRLVAPVRGAWLLSGIVLGLAWPPILMEGAPVTLVWAVYLIGLAVFVLVRPNVWARSVTAGVSLLVMFHLLAVHWPELMAEEMAWWNGLWLFGLITGALMVAWAAEHRQQGDVSTYYSWALLVATLLVPILYFSAVLDGFLVSLAWAVQALILVVAGFVAKVRELRLAGLAVFAIVLFRLLVFDMQAVDPGLRIVTFIGVGLLALVAAYFFARRLRKTGPGEGVEAQSRR